MIYVLAICASMTGAGCAQVTRLEFDSGNACQAALSALVKGREHVFAVCAGEMRR